MSNLQKSRINEHSNTTMKKKQPLMYSRFVPPMEFPLLGFWGCQTITCEEMLELFSQPRDMDEVTKSMADAQYFGTGVMLNGKHVPHGEVYENFPGKGNSEE